LSDHVSGQNEVAMKVHVETLCRQHDELRRLADVYEQELKRPAPDLQALSKCRWTLARLVSGHLAYEKLHLYGTLADRGDTSGINLGERLNILGDRLSDHVRDWTLEMITSDWSGYVHASLELVAVLRAHMAEEEKELYPRLLAAKAA
jgi:hypothetical protein